MSNASSLKRWIPNILTISRLGFFGAIIGFLVADNFRFIVLGHVVTNLHIVLALYFFGAMTDVFDGPLARRWNVATELGDMLDHGIDRIFAIPVFYILFRYLFWVPFLIAIVFEATTISVALSVAWKRRQGIKTNPFPNAFGKTSFILLIVTACIICLAAKWQPYWHVFSYVANGALGLAIVLRITSLIKYFRKK